MSEDIKTGILKLSELIINTTEQFSKYFSQIRTLYESSDPNEATDNIKELKKIMKYKDDVETYASAVPLISQLNWNERIKLIFQLMYNVHMMRNPLEQMRNSLDNVYLQSSLGSSDFNHLISSVHVLKNTYLSYFGKYNQYVNSINNRLIHQVFDGVDDKQINYDKLSDLYNKYQVLDIYMDIIKYIISHYNAPKILQVIEILKDKVLGTKPHLPHSHEWRTFQSYGIMPGMYDTLENIGKKLDIKIKKESDLTNISKTMKVQFIVLTRYTEFIYLPGNISDKTYIKNNAFQIDPQYGVNIKSLEVFDTIKETKSQKIKSNMTFYPKTSKYTKYIILETYDTIHYRILSPWNVFPIYESSSYIIPESYIPHILDNKSRMAIYPSARISTYNKILEEQILKNKGEEIIIETTPYVVNKEQGEIIDKLNTWFIKSKTPKKLSEYRELINGDDFKNQLESIIIKILKSKFDSDKPEIYNTLISTASSITRRISRDILGMTTKSNSISNVFEIYSDVDKIRGELDSIFKKHISSSVNIIVSYRSLCEPIEKKILLFSDTT